MAVVEDVGGYGGSRVERRAWWRGHVVAQRDSGLSGAAYCRAHGLRVKSFYRWQRVLTAVGELEAAGAAPSRCAAGANGSGGSLFAEVVVQAPAGGAALEVVLRNARRVRVHPGFDEATLARLVAVLEGVSC